jgi:hypothetical protein
MRGLDPRIHDVVPRGNPYETIFAWHAIMDCRVSPLRGGPAMTAELGCSEQDML